MRRICATWLASVLLCALLAAHASGAVITNSGDDLRTGWYPNETAITPQLVGGGTFGRLWSTPVEGQVYAQPLLANGTLLVATENNAVYGLDPASGAPKWGVKLGEPWHAADIGCGDLAPNIGITSTPVIDTETDTAYLTHKTYASGSSGPALWYMDAIDLASGAERPGFPVLLSGTAQNAPGETFNATTELQRPGLLLMGGVVYAAFGSDCDDPPWQGWVFGVSTAGSLTARWASVPSGSGAGIWQSGAGLTSDRAGSILLSTGNDGAPAGPIPGSTPPASLGESVVRLTVQGDGTLKATDFFAPFDARSLDGWDADFASGGVTGLPEASFGTAAIPHLAVAVGKDGYVYLLNRDELGGIGEGPAGSDDVVQRIGPYGGVWSRPGVWPGEGGWVYIPTASGGTSAAGSSGNLRIYKYGLSGTGAPALSLQGTSPDAFGFSSGAPVITSNGTASGSALVWIVWAPNGSGAGAELRAYDPVPVGGAPVLRWSAPVGTSSKFAIPGVGGGRVYVGTRDGHVLGFGSPVAPPISGSTTTFATTTIGSSSHATVELTANEALTVTSLSSSSTQFTLGTPVPALPASLAAGAKIRIPATFTPTATGPVAATLTVKTQDGKTATFELSGTGQAPAALLESSPPLVTFGGTAVGGEIRSSAVFTNVGGQSLEVKGIRLPGAPFAAEGVPAVGSKLAPGASVTVTVSFAPTAAGRFEDELGLETTGGNKAVGLSGVAAEAGRLKVEAESTNFGEVTVGASALRTFKVANVGGTPLEITKSKPPFGGAFTALSSLPEGTTIEPGEALVEEVLFSPTATGPTAAGWVLNAKDATGLHEAVFGGVGVAAKTQSNPTPGSSSEVLGGPLQDVLASITGTTPVVPDVELVRRALGASRAGAVAVAVKCPAQESRCFGRVTLSVRVVVPPTAGPRATPRRVVVLVLGSGSFSLAGGGRTTVAIRLSVRGQALLAHLHTLHAQAAIVAHDPRGAGHRALRNVTIALAGTPR